MPKLTKLRAMAFARQNGACYYCTHPMWEAVEDLAAFARVHRLTSRQAQRFQVTAEHLVARCDGGRDTSGNIAAACMWCNQWRHRLNPAPSPEKFRRVCALDLNG